jgi:excisionase family DNA binding protein
MYTQRMRLAWNLKKVKLKIWSMSELEFITGMLKEMTKEMKELRLELMRLRNEQREHKICSRFLTMADACEYLHISRATMTKRLADGEISFATKKGKSWLFPEDRLKAYASGMA